MKYRLIDDVTSDVVFEAYGRDLAGLFENAAMALSSIICQIEEIGKSVSKKIELEGDDVKDLMFNWLQKIIEMVDVDGLFFSRFRIEDISKTKLNAVCYGEESDPGKGGVLVKAVTYHRFNVEKTDDGYKATVSLDI